MAFNLSQNDLVVAAVITAATAGAAYLIYSSSGEKSRPSSTHTLRSPPSPSFFKGHLGALYDYDVDELERYITEYGTVFPIDGILKQRGMCIADLKAASYIFNHPQEFTKPSGQRRFILSWTGPGVLWAEGDQHKRQVRASYQWGGNELLNASLQRRVLVYTYKSLMATATQLMLIFRTLHSMFNN